MDWLSHHNHSENKDQEISGMNISIHTINTKVDMQICISIEDIKAATEMDAEIQLKGGHTPRTEWSQG